MGWDEKPVQAARGCVGGGAGGSEGGEGGGDVVTATVYGEADESCNGDE